MTVLDWLAIVVTAGVGLAAGQIGAWLQSRRDAHAQEAREQAETKRLRLQLADAQRQRERDREQADTTEWRERRLAAYQAVSAATRMLLDEAQGTMVNYLGEDADTAQERMERLVGASRELRDALDPCTVVGTQPTRAAATTLCDAGDRLLLTAMHLPATQVLHRHQYDDEHEDFSPSADAELEDEEAEVNRLIAGLNEAWEAWNAAARAELGVPD